MTALLHVSGLRVAFGPEQAVRDVSFGLQPGERLGLVGESGSGKSTTVLALMGLIRPPGRVAGGTAVLDGQDLLQLPAAAMRKMRGARIALVPQGAMNALNPVLDCAAQLLDLMDAHDALPLRSDRQEWMDGLLRRVGLGPSVARMFPHQLSGGMKQRVCIAFAIALRPTVILADEPTSALDVVVQKQVLRTLRDVQRDLPGGGSTVLVGHDMGLMAQFATTIGVMYAGRLVEIGPVRDLFADSAAPVYAAADRQPADVCQPPAVPRHPRLGAIVARPAAGLPLQYSLSGRGPSLRRRRPARPGDARWPAREMPFSGARRQCRLKPTCSKLTTCR